MPAARLERIILPTLQSVWRELLPVRYVIDKKHRLIVSVGEGSVTFDEIRNHQDQLLRDPDFDPAFNQLIDVTTATRFDLSTDEAREAARRKIMSSASRRAFVASQTAIYGFGRLMEAHAEQHAQIRVFYDRDSALKWLAVNEDSGHY
jgi:hypothetical protein